MHQPGPFLHRKLTPPQPESFPGQPYYYLPSLKIALVHDHTPFPGAAYIQELINVVRNCQATCLHLDDLEQPSRLISFHGFSWGSIAAQLLHVSNPASSPVSQICALIRNGTCKLLVNWMILQTGHLANLTFLDKMPHIKYSTWRSVGDTNFGCSERSNGWSLSTLTYISPSLLLRASGCQSDSVRVHRVVNGYSPIKTFKFIPCMCRNLYFESFLWGNMNCNGRWLNNARFNDLLWLIS